MLHECEVKLDWSDLLHRTFRPHPPTHQRSPGVHLSGVIKHVLRAMGKWDHEDDVDEMPLAVALGVAWEELAVSLYSYIRWQPGEICVDRVYMTPDGITEDGGVIHPALEGERVIEEFKFTLKSGRTHGDVLREAYWMYQLRGYAHGEKINYARLHVAWAAGDYRPPRPKYATYLMSFSDRELEQYWRTIVLNNRDGAVPE